MATLVLGAVGAAIGGGIGGSVLGVSAATLGGFIGSSIGSGVDARLFGSSSARRVEGPRLSDLAVQSSAYGAPVPLVYGTMRVAGNLIWSTGLIETQSEDTTRVGGKGGGKQTVTNVRYSYSASLAVALAGREIESVGRIWADGKLLRSAEGDLAVGGEVRIYTGAETQLPDPLIEATEGAGNAPAFRGLAYVVFESLQLAEFANRIPNFTFEIVTDAGGTVALGDVVADLAARVGLDVEASALDATVKGYGVGDILSARGAIQGLASAYPFDASEVDGVLRFAGHPRASVLSIAESDLGAGPDRKDTTVADKLSVRRTQELELPREILVRHIDPARDYQAGVQRARRLATSATGVTTLDLALVLGADDAKQAAEIQLSRAWIRRQGLSWSLGPKHLALAPGDVVSLTASGVSRDVLIERIELADGVLSCDGVPETGEVYDSAAVGDAGAVPAQEVTDPGDTVLHLLDLPPVGADGLANPIFYAAVAGANAGWRGAAVYLSNDGGASYGPLVTIAPPTVMGVTTDMLGAGPTVTWDRANSVNVMLLRADMALESMSELGVLNGANAAVIGDEIVQFTNAVLEVDGSYTLSGLLRGRRGTEASVGAHAAGERFVLLDAATIAEIAAATAWIGKSYDYKPVSVRATLGATVPQAFAYEGRNLKPFSPVHAAGARNAGGDLTLSWIRRTRQPGDWADGADVPLAEETEAYEVDILDGATVVRTLTASSSQAVYSASDQVADFGAAQPSVAVRIYQLSAVVGRGSPLDATL